MSGEVVKQPGDGNIFVKFEALRNSLKEIIFDQEEAVDKVELEKVLQDD